MHYYQFNIGEYASHTRHLSIIEDIAYRRLLDLAYTTELPLIKDTRQLSRLINMRDHEREISDVLQEFFFEVSDGWVHNRVLKEIEKTGRKSAAARNSIAIRWEKERKAKEDKAIRTYNDRNTDVSENDTDATKIDTTNNPLPITQDPLPETKEDSCPDGHVSTPAGDRRPPVPHEKIIELYHEIFPAAPQVIVKLWGGTRKKHLQARWNEDKSRQTADWWRDFFLWASYSSFLSGNVKPSGGRDTPFMADLGWMIRPENFVKIYEGKYHDLNDIARHERDHGGEK